MESSKTNASYGQCRCCLAKGHHRDIMKEYYINGIREVYFDIFMETFNLFLSTNSLLSTLICSTCIQRVRDATSFRMMVASTERQLLQAIAADDKDTVFVNVPVEDSLESTLDVKLETTVDVKEEAEADVDVGEYESDFALSDYVSDSTDNLVEREAALLGRFARAPPPPLPTRQQLPEICPEYCRQLDMLQNIKVFPKTILKLIEDHETRRVSSSHRRSVISEKLAHIVNLSQSGVHECQICGFNFETFGSIERHMNVHFRNYVCKECGSGFRMMVVSTEQQLLNSIVHKTEDVNKTEFIDVPGRELTSEIKLECEVDTEVCYEDFSTQIREEFDENEEHFESDAETTRLIDDEHIYVEGESELLARFAGTLKPLPERNDLLKICPAFAKHLSNLKGNIIMYLVTNLHT
ncbi:hypothetical protein B5X24_HaOG213501 [Helicoverpa armigera]|uniref:Uncharacterized protein n=1 Tax=Helicoverpa armigera TaxID=29058 RepID=A0A2W1BB14_HELAM|nr:hypothetical protein B5X24_HaOG213501 [Helicoverpa armigera]